MVVVAHPDDELLGLGGTLHKLALEGSVIRVVILGEGITSRSESRDEGKWARELAAHHENINAAKNCINYHELATFSLPDNRFDQVDLLDIIKIVEKEKEDFKPSVIFTHHSGDLNIDHQLTFQAVLTSCRPMNHEPVKTIITFETPSGTEWQSTSDPRSFTPNFYMGISEDDLAAKIKGMECYEYEKRAFPHPRSPEALRLLAQYRGMTIGQELAEAFQIIRCIDG